MPALSQILDREHRAHRRLWLGATICAALAAAASVLLLGISGWFITAAALAGAAGPAVTLAFNYMLPSAGIRLLAIVRTGARYGERLAGHAAALRSMAAVRAGLFGAIAASPPARALAVGRGAALGRLVQDIGMVEAQLIRAPAPWAAGCALLAALAMLSLGGIAAIVSTALVAGVVLLLILLIARAAGMAGDETARAAAALKATLAEGVDAAAELRCYGIDPQFRARIDGDEAEMLDAVARHAALLARIDLLMASGIALAAAGALLASIAAGPAIAALAALAAAMGVDGLSPLARALVEQKSSAAAGARIDRILVEASDGPDENSGTIASGALELPQFLSHPLRPGSIAVIRAPSGVGKTSLFETLVGLRSAKRGMARLGGIDLVWLPGGHLRLNFALAPQDAMLLSATVRENLRLADPDADDDRLWSALRDADLDRRVQALPDGLDSWIGENGERLSGGERRRLSIARTLLSRAPWLLLDEPGEGVDPGSRRRLSERIRERLARTGQGAVVVCHYGDEWAVETGADASMDTGKA